MLELKKVNEALNAANQFKAKLVSVRNMIRLEQQKMQEIASALGRQYTQEEWEKFNELDKKVLQLDKIIKTTDENFTDLIKIL